MAGTRTTSVQTPTVRLDGRLVGVEGSEDVTVLLLRQVKLLLDAGEVELVDLVPELLVGLLGGGRV